MTIHDQLLAIGTPVVKHYIRDLTFHDKNACDKLGPDDIAFWSPRECGSEFVHCSGAERDLRWNLGYLNASDKTWPGRTWYKIEAGKVTPTTIKQARRCFYQALDKVGPAPERRPAIL